MGEAADGCPVVLVLGAGPFPSALSAGLAALGWMCVTTLSADLVALAGAVVMVGGHRAPFQDTIISLAARRIAVVVVGSIRRPLPLIDALRDGATEVVDADLPYADVVDAVACALTTYPDTASPAERRRALLAALHERQREQWLLDRLTPKEQQVLRELAAGRSVGEIAAAEHRGLATVRSHVQSVLRKLEVSSQLSAVAIARRGWREINVADQVI
jgi:DNA-binding NarL/FixJ family response regulator